MGVRSSAEIWPRVGILVGSLAFFAWVASSTQAAEVGTYAFVDVTVVPMDQERVIERQTVLVDNGHIAAIGPVGETEIPDTSTRIDGSGTFLMPGLAEMHGHFPNPNPEIPDRWRDDLLLLYVANGVTTVRGMQGRDHHLELRNKVESREILGPKLYVASPQFRGGVGLGAVRSAADAERLVREYNAAGFDLLKIQEGLRMDVYDAVAQTARAVDIEFAGHVPNEVGLFRALQAGQRTIDHMDNMLDAIEGDEARIPEIVSATRDAGAWVIPTQVLWEVFLLAPPADQLEAQRTEIQYVPRAIRSFWRQALERRGEPAGNAEEGARRAATRRKLLKALSEGGVGILLGTDSPQIYSVPGFSIHREMRVMVESGLTPYQVLASGTRRVAEYLGTTETTGTVAVGKRADLILVNGNPLKDVANVARRAGVVVNGQWLPESQIQERLHEISASSR